MMMMMVGALPSHKLSQSRQTNNEAFSPSEGSDQPGL